MFWSALFLLLAAVFFSMAIHQGSQGDWVKFMLCIVCTTPFFALMLIMRKREFTTSWHWGLPLDLEFRFNYAGIWFGLFQWIFLGLHRRNKILFQTKVYSGKRVPIHRRFKETNHHHGYSSSGIYSESTKRTIYTDWRDSNTYYSIKGRLVYIRAILPDKH